MLASIVIRTFNEERFLGQLLQGIHAQRTNGLEREVVIVDSGSTDRTLEIAHANHCRVAQIERERFSFGRSLNLGCELARGDLLVFVSGHCVPANEQWLEQLVSPVKEGRVLLTYGRQIGGAETRFAEHQIFAKYFPPLERIPQDGFYCNNANAATTRRAWETYRFNEELTGLEDMEFARRAVQGGHLVGYAANAVVYHHHFESLARIKVRFEREAIALQHIMPEVQVTFVDFLRYFTAATIIDWGTALQQRRFWTSLGGIVLYRLMQYWGTYTGNHEHRRLSKSRKEALFYPV